MGRLDMQHALEELVEQSGAADGYDRRRRKFGH
jgi:hypothetical protein